MSALEPALDTQAAAVRAPLHAGIAGLGTALPPEVVPNAAIAERFGVTSEWIERRTGIRNRRRMADDATLADLATEAAQGALTAAGIAAEQVDVLLVATCTPDRVLPNEAVLVAQRLGVPGAMAWDVGIACCGFVAMLAQGTAMIESGRAEHVLVIGAERFTPRIDEDDRGTATLFADGCGAAVLSAGTSWRIGAITMGSDADSEALTADFDEAGLIRMDGHTVFQHAVARMVQACRDTLAKAGLTLADIDLVVPHQANSRIIAAVGDRLALDPARVADYVGELGNVSAASLPLALSLAEQDGRIPERGRVLLCAFGAGFAWGGAILECGGTS